MLTSVSICWDFTITYVLACYIEFLFSASGQCSCLPGRVGWERSWWGQGHASERPLRITPSCRSIWAQFHVERQSESVPLVPAAENSISQPKWWKREMEKGWQDGVVLLPRATADLLLPTTIKPLYKHTIQSRVPHKQPVINYSLLIVAHDWFASTTIALISKEVKIIYSCLSISVILL